VPVFGHRVGKFGERGRERMRWDILDSPLTRGPARILEQTSTREVRPYFTSRAAASVAGELRYEARPRGLRRKACWDGVLMPTSSARREIGPRSVPAVGRACALDGPSATAHPRGRNVEPGHRSLDGRSCAVTTSPRSATSAENRCALEQCRMVDERVGNRMPGSQCTSRRRLMSGRHRSRPGPECPGLCQQCRPT